MALASVFTRAQTGMTAPLVHVEVHIAGGLPGMSIVGLPEAAVKESKDRVRAAIKNSGYQIPPSRIIVNLAPADLPKEGGRFDLAIALCILAAARQIPSTELAHFEFLGELSLSGSLRPVRGALPATLAAAADGRALVVPAENGSEVGLARESQARIATHLAQVSAALSGREALPPAPPGQPGLAPAQAPDLLEVRGQQHAKRALEVAAAGGHSLLMTGPPGSGKTMLASRLPGILPPMTDAEALEAAAVASITGPESDPAEHWRQRPFRAPHHTASGVALVGGGSTPQPGEITLAHHGVLFLDELPEFDRKVLEVLREPMESGHIHISRAARRADFPASFQLLAAMNPCPCGYLGDPSSRCHCSAERVERYRARISGPLLDRIDMQLNVGRVPREVLLAQQEVDGEPSAQVRQRVVTARAAARQRGQTQPNGKLGEAGVQEHCQLTPEARHILEQAIDRLGFSARAFGRILKVSRTIADLANAQTIGATHVAEAVTYREIDRN